VAARKSNPSPETPNEAEASTPSFEAAIEQLATIVDQLEAGELPLEQSLALFERGILLAKSSQAQLDRAEKRVEQLLGFDASGRPVVDELDGSE
jgi:exodeoxyribonuclease VII small subunit